jgi:Protein of unknown function (DUF3134)
MTVCYNPSLSEESRNQPMRVAPFPPRESLLNWLESSGRFHASESDELPDHIMPEELDDILEPEGYALDTEEEDLD